MRNSDSISLSKGNTIDIMGKLSFVVADANKLRFAPIVKTTEPGIYELRGTVHDEKFDTFVWTPLLTSKVSIITLTIMFPLKALLLKS